jgi:hypothetical protein
MRINQRRNGSPEIGWPGRVRSTGRVAKRQEAAPFGSIRASTPTSSFRSRVNVLPSTWH